MSVYVVTGVSRGIGLEFLKQLSEDPKNLIVGLVRDKVATEQKVATELGGRPNVHILHGDLANYATLKQAAADTADIVGERGVDYLVANGGLVPHLDAYGPIGALADKVEEVEAVSSQLWQTNVIGNMHLFHLFLPLVLKGHVKKVITLSTGMADLDLINNCEVDIAGLYAASKAAMNVIVAKFNAQYKKDGVLFLSISPGFVEVGRYTDVTPEEAQGMTGFVGNLLAYAPHFKGPITPEESVRHIRSTWEKASIEGGFGGAFVSHLGNKQWV
ncbi:putative short chain dehydrogenase [Aspergillus campestris IBT 28561]|uniref:Short chain dehydrogenase n=1 Tax=Aspergillus campestris (strain IBT 28561) TaxID=1392248 RepID=A0A2I1D9Z4_ASPC2|nr:putative short chain dehydrogenase [Aspergillus campestris IBT 28561]PKY06703.1 putative short chain dehydrogenase [Aspergillus campestris IBT 28561]